MRSSSAIGPLPIRGAMGRACAATLALIAFTVLFAVVTGAAYAVVPLPGMTHDWTQVVSAGFTDPNNTYAPSVTKFKDRLYLSTIASEGGAMFSGSSKSGGDIWCTKDGVAWEQVGTAGLGNPHNSTFRFVVFRDKLYALSDNLNDHGIEIWVSSDGTDFAQIEKGGFGGDKDSSSSNPFVFQDRLIVPVSNTRTGAQIWVSEDGETFQQVVDAGLGDPNNTGISGLDPQNPGPVFQGKLYVGVTNPSAGGEIWRTADGLEWERVVDEGLGKSANIDFSPGLVYNDQLYVVSATTGGLDKLKGFDIFRTGDGETWEKVVSDGFNVGPERNIVGWLTEFKGELYLTGETMDPRILTPTQPSERVPPKGFQLYKSSDGANWTQVGQDGFGADSSLWATMTVLGGVAYLGAYDYHEGDQLWKSTDGTQWELIFREPYPSWFSEGGGPFDFQGHLLWVDNDLKRGVEIWRTDKQVVAEETTTTVTGGTGSGTSGEGSTLTTQETTEGGTVSTGAAGQTEQTDGGGLSGGLLALIIGLGVVAVAAIGVAAYVLGASQNRTSGGQAPSGGTRPAPARFCSSCGSPLYPGSAFCPGCGKRL
jgi:hypothetical protein